MPKPQTIRHDPRDSVDLQCLVTDLLLRNWKKPLRRNFPRLKFSRLTNKELKAAGKVA